jgi:hypothetical protein
MADEPHASVTRQELSDALAAGPRRRPTTLINAAPADAPAWDWDAELAPGERLELHELRQVVAEQRTALDALTAGRDAAEARERELRLALRTLAAAGLWQRRGVVAELERDGLI